MFLDLVMAEPVFSPIGVIDNYTHTLKNNIHTISITAPTRNVIRILVGIGVIVKHNNNTIPRIGNTAFNVSDNFSLNLDWIDNYETSFYAFFLVYHKLNKKCIRNKRKKSPQICRDLLNYLMFKRSDVRSTVIAGRTPIEGTLTKKELS